VGTTPQDQKTYHFENARPSQIEEPPPEWLRAKLVVLTGTQKGHEFPITQARTIIGRGEDSTIAISDPSMSRHHAELVYGAAEFRVRDLDSSNGTLLNGSVVEEYAIRNGDKLTMGETIVRFQVERLESV
jgi:pSer/pThr/pTyr-binding forkhead associated (FHA) protein